MQDDLGTRIKRYEAASASLLPWRLPVIARIDGKSFSKWTKGLSRPWCQELVDGMNNAATELCKEVQGARIAYIQSDEISLLLWPWNENDSMPYFGNEVQKLVSITAGIASASLTADSSKIHGKTKLAVFDSRAFVVPQIDVVNYFIWRQQDAERNSLLNLTQMHYSAKQMQGAKKAKMHDMLHAKGVNWNDLPDEQKRGRCVIQKDSKWIVDNKIPVFTQDRDYINNLMILNKPVIDSES